MGYKETLLSPIQIGTRTCQNRFFMQAMECNGEDETGNPSADTTERYCNLAKGEAGLISLEAISVTRESHARDNQLMIMDKNRRPRTHFVRAVMEANPKSLFIFQLTHSGELPSPDFSRRVCIKPLPGHGGDVLTEDEADKIMDEFVVAAQVAHDAGAMVHIEYITGMVVSLVVPPKQQSFQFRNLLLCKWICFGLCTVTGQNGRERIFLKIRLSRQKRSQKIWILTIVHFPQKILISSIFHLM